MMSMTEVIRKMLCIQVKTEMLATLKNNYIAGIDKLKVILFFFRKRNSIRHLVDVIMSFAGVVAMQTAYHCFIVMRSDYFFCIVVVSVENNTEKETHPELFEYKKGVEQQCSIYFFLSCFTHDHISLSNLLPANSLRLRTKLFIVSIARIILLLEHNSPDFSISSRQSATVKTATSLAGA